MTEYYDGLVVFDGGEKRWFLNNKHHRIDGPAVERADGTKEWHLNGKLHREDGPAIELTDGTKEWILNGKRHREDGPAVEYASGTKYWYLNSIYYGKHEPKNWNELVDMVRVKMIMEI